jgi:NADPH-dependent 2,4-dienoyl-CoA reductase/sulfur reductase-like enzyme
MDHNLALADLIDSAWMVRACSQTFKDIGLKLRKLRTLVGSGLLPKSDFARPLASLVPRHISHIPEHVQTFSPESSLVTTVSGRDISYDFLVVAAGLQINYGAIKGLPEALSDEGSGVSTIYSYETCDKVWSDIENLKSGRAVFTQPSGVIKCAGGK